MPSGVVQFDAQRRVLHANGRLAALVGEASLEGLVAAVVEVERPTLVAAIDAVLAAGLDADLDLHLVGERVCRVALRALTDDDGSVTGGLACVDDATEAVRLRSQLELRATFDALTGCYTRVALLGRRVASRVFEPVVLCDAHPVSPRASVGTAWVAAGGDLRALVGDADAAMYEDKRDSRS